MTTLRLATAADDATLRALLRDNGMPTWVDMSLQREPSFFAGGCGAGAEWAVLAEEDGRTVGMYTAALLPVHVDGDTQRLGYLGRLRVDPAHRRRVRHLRAGYASIRRLAPAAGTLPWWFTVVASENTAARRLFEAGLPGLPTYHPQGDYLTFALPAARGRRAGLWRAALAADLGPMVALHNAQAARLQFAPVLDAALVRHIGLERFVVFEAEGTLLGVAALWDQRAFKQVVARRYRAPLGTLVPAYNLYARLMRRVPLPREGEMLQQSSIAFLALHDAALPRALELLRDLLSRCATPVATLGLHAGHELVPVLDALKPLRYPARVYVLGFEQRPGLRPLPAQPEAAWL